MNSLGLQDTFEPYYEGRRNTFASIQPAAVERARRIKERIEQARKERLKAEEPAGDGVGSRA